MFARCCTWGATSRGPINQIKEWIKMWLYQTLGKLVVVVLFRSEWLHMGKPKMISRTETVSRKCKADPIFVGDDDHGFIKVVTNQNAIHSSLSRVYLSVCLSATRWDAVNKAEWQLWQVRNLSSPSISGIQPTLITVYLLCLFYVLKTFYLDLPSKV